MSLAVLDEEPGPVDLSKYWDPHGSNPGPDFRVDINEHDVVKTLLDIQSWGTECSKDPYTWGFVIYSAIFTDDADARFNRGVAKLCLWLRHWALQTRYAGIRSDEGLAELDARPRGGGILPSHDLARRLKFDVFENYPGKETVVANGEDGGEDFTAIGHAFCRWVNENALETNELYVRNDHCLIIDEKALRTLEALPEPPPTGTLAKRNRDNTSCWSNEPLASQTWVWILDRTYFQKYAIAKRFGHEDTLPPRNYLEERRYEPWLRIRISALTVAWFKRPRRLSPPVWESVVARDRGQWDLVNWWDAYADHTNEVSRSFTERGVGPLGF